MEEVLSRKIARLRQWPARWRRLLLAVGGVLLVLLVIGLWQAMRPDNSAAQIKAQADAATEQGDYAKALKLLQPLAGKGTEAEQVEMYGKLGRAAASAGQVGEGIRYFTKRHALDPATAPGDAVELAVLYERSNDRAAALVQYKLALDYVRSQPASQRQSFEVANLEAVVAQFEARR